MRLAPWDYVFLPFNQTNFPDLFRPVWVSSIILLAILVIMYNVRTRILRRHAPYLDMYEWLLWTGVVVFSLLLVFSLFVWDFLFVLSTMVVGAAFLVWVRFIRFPPLFEAYDRKLARERYFTRTKYSRPEATIRAKPIGRSKPPRRRRRR